MQQTKRRGGEVIAAQAFLQVCTVGRARVPGCKILYTGALLIRTLGDCATTVWRGVDHHLKHIVFGCDVEALP